MRVVVCSLEVKFANLAPTFHKDPWGFSLLSGYTKGQNQTILLTDISQLNEILVDSGHFVFYCPLISQG